MKTSRRIALAVALALPVLPLVVSAQQPAGPAAGQAAPAPAEPTKDQKDEASRRFKRGIELFQEGDYRAALIEFKRANELAPNFNVLYNIGNVHFQLQDYANALMSFESYLAQGGSKVDEKRRAEVDKDIEKLRTRVARIEITTNVPDVEISIDDVSMGKTPFAKPLLVNPGRHRITATKDGRTSAGKTVEVASFDSISVPLDLADQTKPNDTTTIITPPPLPSASAAPTASASSTAPPPPPPKSIPWGGWAVTGAAVLGAGITGGMALSKSGELADLRKGDSGATKQQLDDAASSTSTLALVSDIFTGVAVVSGVVTLYFTLKDPAPAAKKEALVKDVKLGVTPSGVSLTGSF